MSNEEFVSLEELRAVTRKTVEINGRKYQIRQLTVIELGALWEAVPIAVDPEPTDPNEQASKKPKQSIKLKDGALSDAIMKGVIQPKLEQPYDVPAMDQELLFNAICEFSSPVPLEQSQSTTP